MPQYHVVHYMHRTAAAVDAVVFLWRTDIKWNDVTKWLRRKEMDEFSAERDLNHTFYMA